MRLVYSSKRRRIKHSPSLDNAGAFIRSLVRSGADFYFHREAEQNRDELRLRDTHIKNMVSSGKLDSEVATAAFEHPQFVIVGHIEEEREDRRIQREFGITITVERPRSLGCWVWFGFGNSAKEVLEQC